MNNLTASTMNLPAMLIDGCVKQEIINAAKAIYTARPIAAALKPIKDKAALAAIQTVKPAVADLWVDMGMYSSNTLITNPDEAYLASEKQTKEFHSVLAGEMAKAGYPNTETGACQYLSAVSDVNYAESTLIRIMEPYTLIKFDSLILIDDRAFMVAKLLELIDGLAEIEGTDLH